jgi:hypothetical protein
MTRSPCNVGSAGSTSRSSTIPKTIHAAEPHDGSLPEHPARVSRLPEALVDRPVGGIMRVIAVMPAVELPTI